MAILDLQEALDLIEKGQAEEAIPLLTTWIRQMPTYAAMHVVLARAYEAAQQWNEARAAWKDAHFLMPNSPAIVEGLARTRRVAAQTEPAGEDHLTMDLDLQAEFEATLEALLNPFTLPHQVEPTIEETPPPAEEQDETLAQVEAALAVVSNIEEEETTTSSVVVPEEEVYIEEEVLDEQDAEQMPSDDDSAAPSIYDEIEQLIKEKEEHQEPDAAAKTEEAPAAQEDIEPPLEEEKQAIEALEAMVWETDEDEASEVLGGWDEFEAEAEVEDDPSPPNQDIEDLERLINELESARIVPQPELDEVPPPDLTDDIEDMVSETLARIFASQRQYHEAARVYEQLALQHPEEADRFNQLAVEMRALAAGDSKE